MNDRFSELREAMVENQILSRGITDTAVLNAMGKIPRHRMVPEEYRDDAYGDHPVPIGLNQTISQPYIVALMTELLQLDKTSRVLEVGTGSGYQTAVLAETAGEVYSLEILPELYDRSRKILDELGYKNICQKLGSGYQGWPEKGPYDGILVTAAPEEIPVTMKAQMKDGGRMVIPVGGNFVQNLVLVKYRDGTHTEEVVTAVRFVKMVKQLGI